MKKILLVEDDFYVRGLYKIAFEKKGYEVIAVEDGDSALERFKQGSFDFIILDLMLPGTPGMDVLKTIKNSNDTPVYILTNVGDDEILQKVKFIGANGYFLKVNYTPSQLVAAIEKNQQEATN
ncbi:MAG TPA: response regulator [Candidatus Bathyarchaeia archaeon]|nr:response regulator [Candidatus Bathyarchaeia archaeon]